VKFINEGDDCDEEDDTVFEVALTKWLEEKLDEMITKISWPPKSEESIALKKELDTVLYGRFINVVVLKLYMYVVSYYVYVFYKLIIKILFLNCIF